jgi:hypothetical protein
VKLDLSHNRNLTYNMGSFAFPNSLQMLGVAGTGYQGTLPVTMGTGYLPSLSCLLVQDSPALCGSIPEQLPLLEVYNTSLGKVYL